MNQREIEAMRERLNARTVAEGKDEPVIYWVMGALWVVAFVAAIFS